MSGGSGSTFPQPTSISRRKENISAFALGRRECGKALSSFHHSHTPVPLTRVNVDASPGLGIPTGSQCCPRLHLPCPQTLGWPRKFRAQLGVCLTRKSMRILGPSRTTKKSFSSLRFWRRRRELRWIAVTRKRRANVKYGAVGPAPWGPFGSSLSWSSRWAAQRWRQGSRWQTSWEVLENTIQGRNNRSGWSLGRLFWQGS